MKTSRRTTSTDRTRTRDARVALALLALAAAAAPRLVHADASSVPPVSECSDFACEK
jgi:hypothetical protein